jgi:hypothetical protein
LERESLEAPPFFEKSLMSNSDLAILPQDSMLMNLQSKFSHRGMPRRIVLSN